MPTSPSSRPSYNVPLVPVAAPTAAVDMVAEVAFSLSRLDNHGHEAADQSRARHIRRPRRPVPLT